MVSCNRTMRLVGAVDIPCLPVHLLRRGLSLLLVAVEPALLTFFAVILAVDVSTMSLCIYNSTG
jgi:hypothetical protein